MRIGFIGLGTMGGPMASNLMKAGHSLIVNDVRRAAGDRFVEQGARWADSPADAAREVELILTSLPGPKEVEQVALGEQGIIHGAGRDAVYADLSTSSPTLIRSPGRRFTVDSPTWAAARCTRTTSFHRA